MKRPIRYLLRIAGALGCLLLLAWLGLVAYALLNKSALLEKARTALQDRVGGEVRIGKLDLTFFRHFPNVTARLSDVSLRDSAWQRHHHDLLRVTDIYISCNPFRSLVQGRIQIAEMDLEHGTLYFFTDSTGYSNTVLLRAQKQQKPERTMHLPDIRLTDIRWVMDRQDKHKLFDLDIRRLYCQIAEDNRLLRFGISTNIRVNNFSFSTEKGSFIQGKRLSGNFTVDFNTASKILQFQEAKLAIDDRAFAFTGRFFPTVAPDPFFLKIETENIRFREAAALLTPTLQQKLERYDIDKPISVHVQLDAGSADDRMPQIQVRLDLVNGSVQTPAGRFTETSFNGSFTNEWVRGQKREDENSGLRFHGFTGRMQDLPLHADTITISNLRHPQLICHLHSHFGLEALNGIMGSQTVQFTDGRGTMDLRYQGPLSENDTAGTVVNGRLDLDSAGVSYLPHPFRLSNGKGTLLFKDQDLFIEQLSVQAGNTKILVKGVAKNLVALLDKNTENVGVDLHLNAPHLDLEDFTALTGSASAPAAARRYKSPLGTAFARVDRVLKEGAIHVGLEAGDLRFRKFTGAQAKANLVFDDHEIKVNRLTIEQGSGSIDGKARLDRKAPGEANPISLETRLHEVDLPTLFTAFNDFGQSAISAKNLKGRLTADIRLEGAITSKAKMVANSLKGNIDFTISGGELLDFEPMERVKSAVLKNRDLSAIRFADLKNHIDLDSTTLHFQRMEIRSTVLTLYVQGIYDLKSGPDMSLQVPLSNLSKNQNMPPDSKGNDGKAGLSVRLRARRGEDGKLKISWDPFRKALKNEKQPGGRGRAARRSTSDGSANNR